MWSKEEHLTDINEVRNEIIIYGLMMAAAVEIVSFFIIGFSLMFLLGLLIGTGVSVLGFIILMRTGKSLMEVRSRFPILLGYMLRLVMYAVSFLFCIKLSLQCGCGCGLGFVTIHFGILFLYGIVYRFIKKKKNPLNDWSEPKQWNDFSVYDEEEDDW